MSAPRSTTAIQSQLSTLRNYIFSTGYKAASKKLDLSGYNGKLSVPINFPVEKGELVSALQELSQVCPDLRTVDLSGHNEMIDIDIAQFRLHFPKLSLIILHNINLGQFCVSATELAELTAKGIEIVGEAALVKSFQKRVENFSMEHEIATEAEEKMMPKVSFISQCHRVVQDYIKTTQSKGTVAKTIETLGLSTKEAAAFTAFIDPVTKKYMDIPVCLNHCFYDLNTVIEFQGKDPHSSFGFKPTDVGTGKELRAKLQATLYSLNTNRQINRIKPEMEKIQAAATTPSKRSG
jgi:hypothetical protein